MILLPINNRYYPSCCAIGFSQEHFDIFSFSISRQLYTIEKYCKFLNVSLCGGSGARATSRMKSEDNVWESVLSCYGVGSGEQTQIVRLG